MKRRVIDSHLHLDDRIEGPADNAVSALDDALVQAGVARGVVLHLQVQRWPVEEVAEALSASERLVGMINVHPFEEDAENKLRRGIEELGFIGLKLHPRIQNFSLDDPRVHKLVRFAGELGVPAIIDAFPDGDWLMQGFDPLAFARVAKSCPDSRIIVAHFGGHRCIDMMMLAKRLPNISLDMSFSLLYYRGSSVVSDLMYCFKSMRFERVFFGSDYPDRPIGESLDSSLLEFKRAKLSDAEQEKLLFLNAKEFFGWNDV